MKTLVSRRNHSVSSHHGADGLLRATQWKDHTSRGKDEATTWCMRRGPLKSAKRATAAPQINQPATRPKECSYFLKAKASASPTKLGKASLMSTKLKIAHHLLLPRSSSSAKTLSKKTRTCSTRASLAAISASPEATWPHPTLHLSLAETHSNSRCTKPHRLESSSIFPKTYRGSSAKWERHLSKCAMDGSSSNQHHSKCSRAIRECRLRIRFIGRTRLRTTECSHPRILWPLTSLPLPRWPRFRCWIGTREVLAPSKKWRSGWAS